MKNDLVQSGLGVCLGGIVLIVDCRYGQHHPLGRGPEQYKRT